MSPPRTIRAARAVAPPQPTIRSHGYSPDRIVALAVERGADRPTDAVLRNPVRFARWEASARVLVFAKPATPADLAEMIYDANRWAGLTPERIGEVINAALVAVTAGGVAHWLVWSTWS